MHTCIHTQYVHPSIHTHMHTHTYIQPYTIHSYALTLTHPYTNTKYPSAHTLIHPYVHTVIRLGCCCSGGVHGPHTPCLAAVSCWAGNGEPFMCQNPSPTHIATPSIYTYIHTFGKLFASICTEVRHITSVQTLTNNFPRMEGACHRQPDQTGLWARIAVASATTNLFDLVGEHPGHTYT